MKYHIIWPFLRKSGIFGGFCHVCYFLAVFGTFCHNYIRTIATPRVTRAQHLVIRIMPNLTHLKTFLYNVHANINCDFYYFIFFQDFLEFGSNGFLQYFVLICFSSSSTAADVKPVWQQRFFASMATFWLF